jgi:hypothetical protein
LCAAAVLAIVAVLARAAGWNGPPKLSTSTAIWPFYLDTYDRATVWTARALLPLGALALTWWPLSRWLRDEARSPGWPTLVGLVATTWLLHLSVGVVRHGMVPGLTRTFARTGLEYWGDLHFLIDDPRHFLARFPDLGGLSQHGETHPPALTLFLYGLWRLGCKSALAAELVCSTFAALTALPLYAAARRLADESIARFAVPLFLFACSTVAFSVLAMDVVTMFFATVALYGFARALDGDVWGGLIWGVALSVTTLCTFTAFLLVLTYELVLAARWGELDRRRVLALFLGPAAFLAVYGVLHFGFGYRPWVVYRSAMLAFASSDDAQRVFIRGLVGNPIAFLGALGLPIMGLSARAIGGSVRRLLEWKELPTSALVLGAVLPPALCIVIGKPRSEVEHIFMLFVPALVLGTAAAARRWYGRSFGWLGFAVPALVVQSILIEIFLETFW